mmetsp:Transcript_26564/g.50080  ORF Transcript_26564/g.50080 Transcript_26564/m.50080 type:complete len:223 (-) Transcript_26564:89-757(-)
MADRKGNGLFGLRLISNNVVANGDGRDAVVHLDKAFRGGKQTPRPADWTIHGCRGGYEDKGPKTRPQRLPVREMPLQRSAKSLVASVRPQVLERWRRTASASCAVEPGPRRSPPEFDVKAAPRLATADAPPDAMKAMQASLFKVPELPVSKYHWFPEKKVYNALDGRGKTFEEPQEQPLKLASPPVEKYRYFAEPTVEYSNHFEAVLRSRSESSLLRPQQTI